MVRIIEKNKNLAGTILDTPNSYYRDCDLSNSKMKNILNDTFIRCNLTNSNWTEATMMGVSIKDCNTDNIKLLPIVKGFIRVIRADALEGLKGLFPAYSHQFMSILFRKFGDTLTGKYRTRFYEMADDLLAHPELCYTEVIDLWNIKWYPDEKHLKMVIKVLKSDPKLYQVLKNQLEPKLKPMYPNVSESEWE